MEVLELKDIKAVPDIVHSYPDRVKSEGTPLVIDNGAKSVLYNNLCNAYYMMKPNK